VFLFANHPKVAKSTHMRRVDQEAQLPGLNTRKTGPDAATFEKASKADTSKPEKFEGGLAFMLETSAILKVPLAARRAAWRDKDYHKCWEGLQRLFNTAKP